MRTIVRITAFFLFFCLFFSVQSHALILFADNFENSTDWDGRINSVNLITSGSPGNWGTIWPSQIDARHGEISASHGHTGKGFRFSLNNSGGSTQESCLFGSTPISQPTLHWGYWFKASTINWGTASKTLKMTRFYPGPGPSGPSIIPEWKDGYMSIYYNTSINQSTGYALPDTNWHSHIWQFERGNNANDGVIRFWVDGVLRYEKKDVNWNSTGTNFTFANFPTMQGNLSGDYNGGILYTYWDDYIWATTFAEVESFLGNAPNPPMGFKKSSNQ